MSGELPAERLSEARFGLEVATRPIPAALRPYVRSWSGYSERTPDPCRRRELPAPQVVVIFEFGPPIQVFESGSEVRASRYRDGFVAGLDDNFTLTEHAGFQTGVQVNLTPLGARALFGCALWELSHLVVQLTDLLPREHRSIADRLASATCWQDRLRVVETLLSERLLRAPPAACEAVLWATRQIDAARGTLDVSTLSAELGYSRKHLSSLFREHVGLAPKLYASLVRFDHVVQRLKAPGEASWANIALDLGYSDQSHLVHQVKRFSGLTPTGMRALIRGDVAHHAA
jgi:AraC-like DNA-binding protein